MTNPLLAEWDTPFGLPPFDRISDDDFGSAFETARIEHLAEVAAIAGQGASATPPPSLPPLQ